MYLLDTHAIPCTDDLVVLSGHAMRFGGRRFRNGVRARRRRGGRWRVDVRRET